MKDKLINIIAAVAVAILWVAAFGKFMEVLRGVGSLFRPRASDYFSALILAPIWEEYVFRHIPLKWVSSFSNKDYTWAVMVISSVLFGLIHGGVYNIFIQGVVGMISAWLYFRNDKSYWSCVVYHMAYNMYIILV
jgi:uncharacterized protein